MFGVRSSSEQLCRCQLLPLQGPIHIYSKLLGAARSSSELLGATLSLLVAPWDRDQLIFTRGLLGVVRSCSEQLCHFIQVASLTGTYRYSHLLAATRSFLEQKCLSNQPHSKCTNGTVYKVKTSQPGNIVKHGQCLEKLLCTRLRILVTPSPV